MIFAFNVSSDLECSLAAIFEIIFKASDFEPKLGSLQDAVGIFLNAAKFSEHDEGHGEASMSFADFRSWCTILPSVRKFLGSLLMPLDPGLTLCYIVSCFLRSCMFLLCVLHSGLWYLF